MTSRVTTPDILGNALSPEQAERAEVAQTLRYDYSQLGEQAGAIRNHAIEIKRNERRANEAIVEAGQHLIAVKEALPHGQWEDWLQTEFHMTDRTARTLMAIATKFIAKTEIISVLSPTVLGMLASPSVPEEAVQAVVDAAGDGKVSVAAAKEIIAEHKPARLSDGDLTTIVQTWMAGFWRRPWPENPSHTNGTLWQELTAWMRENVPQPWQESDLKTAIKRLHYAHVQQWSTSAANRPAAPASTSPDFASVLVLEGIVRHVWDALNPTIDAATDKKLAQTARMDAINKAGQFWNQCKAAMGDDIRAYRHADLQQAIENVCSEKERTVRQAQPWTPPGLGQRLPVTPAPTTQPAPQPVPTRMTPPEIEALVRSAASFATAADLRAEAKAMRGPVWRSILSQAGNVLYQDVAAAMNAVADQLEPVQTDALEQQNPADFGITFPDPDTRAANLAAAEEAAAAKLRQMQIEGVRDDLNTALEALTRFGDLTGKHTETLLAGRELRRLLAMLDAERLVNVQLPQAA